MEADPYLPPTAPVEVPEGTDVEVDRNAHLAHEVQLESVGAVHWLGAGGMALLALLTLGIATQGGTTRVDFESWVLIAVEVVIGVLLAALGWGYRALAPWVRWPGTATCAIGLLAYPFGPFVSLWILYLVWCRKGRRVLAPDYADVRRQTPHLHYRRTPGDRIATIAVVGVMLVLLGLFLWY